MARSEFRYNKKRKHYSYIFKNIGNQNKNILISSKPRMTKKKKRKNKSYLKEVQNIKLYRHPNRDKKGEFYLIPVVYIDDKKSFSEIDLDWNFDKNDKRKVKRIIKKYSRKNKKSVTKPE